MEVLTVHSQGSKEGNKVQITSSSEGIGRYPLNPVSWASCVSSVYQKVP